MIYNKPKDFIFRVPDPKKAEKQSKKEKRKNKKDNIEPPIVVIKQKPRKQEIIKIASFFVTLYIGTVLAFIIPLRPTYSESEKRTLQEFPEFSVWTLFITFFTSS